MKIAVISFTEHGSLLNFRLCRELEKTGHLCGGSTAARYASRYGLMEAPRAVEWTAEHFSNQDALIFIGAAGIAVRSIAPFLKDKYTDPAVLAVDERGTFVLSLLSGHIGGANALTETVAGILGAVPVITTGTEVNGKFAADVFAKRNCLFLTDKELSRKISASLIDGDRILFYCEGEYSGRLPEELEETGMEQIENGKEVKKQPAIAVTVKAAECFPEHVLCLVPKAVCIGIGCKKNTKREKLEIFIRQVLEENRIAFASVSALASIDLKKEEAGILELSESWKIPFFTYPAEKLAGTEGNFFHSDFVKNITGVGNVCERAAVCHSGGRLLIRKQSWEGITIAAAIQKWSVTFE